MNILNIEHISKIYGEKTIFEDASFGIHEGDKIGIIGINGTGKTTLLRMVAGIEEPDVGQIVRQNGLRIAYLPQNLYVCPCGYMGALAGQLPETEAVFSPILASCARVRQ